MTNAGPPVLRSTARITPPGREGTCGSFRRSGEFPGTLNDGTSGDGSTTSGCFAGHCDWRLPAIGELAGIVDASAPGCSTFTGPCVDQTAFGPTVASGYFSASTVASAPSIVWFVNFSGGGVSGASKSGVGYVRAVRSGL